MKSNVELRKFWLEEAKNIPQDAPLYVEAMASRIEILISDIEELYFNTVYDVAQDRDPKTRSPGRSSATDDKWQVYPKDWPKHFNGSSEPCDMLVGPCSCGAWHQSGEIVLRKHVGTFDYTGGREGNE